MMNRIDLDELSVAARNVFQFGQILVLNFSLDKN